MSELSKELDYALLVEDYYRTKLLYWKHRRQELERRIETNSTQLLNELEQIAREAWGNDDLQPGGN